MGNEQRVEVGIPILENRQQRRARERAEKKGLILPGSLQKPSQQEPQQPVDPRIAIGHVMDENISHIFYMSMMKLLAYRLTMVRNRVLNAQGDPGHLDVGRNKVVQSFLQSPMEWLFWIDTDMAFNPAEFDLVFEAADADERPIVSGLYYSQMRRPVAFRNRLEPADGMVHAAFIDDPETDELIEVDGVGFGFVVVHRSVFERVAESFGPTHPHRPWFDCSDFGPYQEPPSEDLSFCARARALDIPIFVHAGARVGHIKQYVVLGERLQPNE